MQDVGRVAAFLRGPAHAHVVEHHAVVLRLGFPEPMPTRDVRAFFCPAFVRLGTSHPHLKKSCKPHLLGGWG